MEDNEKKTEEFRHEPKDRFSPVFFEVGGTMGKIERAIHWATSIIMLLLTVLILAGIFVSTVRIPNLFRNLLSGSPNSLLTLLEFAAEVIMAIELIHVIIAPIRSSHISHCLMTSSLVNAIISISITDSIFCAIIT